jgi:2-methylaconitate cis-trans-isomerase PrpF
MSMQTAHKSYAGTGGIATAVAALLPGTIVHACASRNSGDPGRVRIGHPAGVLDVEVKLDTRNGAPHVASATVARTARRIMSGEAWVSRSLVA